MSLLLKELERIKKMYLGKWIAIAGSKVVAVSTDYHELHQQLRAKGMTDVIVIHSPTKRKEKLEFLI